MSFCQFARMSALTALLAVASATAQAALISGQGSPSTAVPGGTVHDFENVEVGTYSVLNLPGLTISGTDDHGGKMTVSTQHAGNFNTTGARSLQNATGSGYQTFLFTFSSPVSAFAFRFGGLDWDWVLTAVDSTFTLIEAHTLAPSGAVNGGHYYGISAPGIHQVSLTSSRTGNQDWVLIDDFTVAQGPAVPEPGSAALVAIGAAAVAITRFRKR